MKFTHLHVHSHYSLLDGLAKIDQLLDYAKKMGMDSCALTDHGALYGAVEFYKKAKEKGVKPIIGTEMYLAFEKMSQERPNIDDKRYHLVLLAKNEEGYKNLVKLITLSNLEGFYYKPRIDEETLAKYSSGLIALSACIQGKIPQLILAKKIKEAEIQAKKYQEIFGKDNFYLEVQHHPNFPDQKKVNQSLIALSKKTSIPLVATNDVHYLKPEDAEAQDILMLINTGANPNDPERLTMKADDFSMRSPEQMIKDFKDLPEAIENTQKIAEKCNFQFELGKVKLPKFIAPDAKTEDEYLTELCHLGIKKRYGNNPKKEVFERLNYELSTIKQTGFASYFLIVQDFVNWAKQNRVVVGPGRGSVGGSLAAYLLNITNIDPLKYDLLFERFLNPERISLPDIDLDFTDRRRNEVIDYVAQKYGQDKVAQIITFGTMAARAVIRDVGRALNYTYSYCDKIAKMIPFGQTLDQTLANVDEFRQIYLSDEQAKKLVDFAKKLEGVVRHASTHACGVVISAEPLNEIVPLQHPTQDDKVIVTQYEMHSIEDLGLLKMDFLGLKNLTIIEDTLARIYKVQGKSIDIENIPQDDKNTFKLFQAGDTIGIFQLESSGMQRYLKLLKPTEFEDIIAMVALYRPGPMALIPEYIDGKHKKKNVEYLHPKLKPILEKTFGIPVYQEQIMKIVQELADFTLGEADVLRKAIGKKIQKLLMAQKEKFIGGATKNGINENISQTIWHWIEPFASYSFNRCLSGDTEIIDGKSGRKLTLKEIAKGKSPSDVISLNRNLKLQKSSAIKVFKNGIKPVNKVITRLGKQIKATLNHPFLTINGWKVLGELKPGDRIALARKIPIKNKKLSAIKDYQLVVLGYILAEGNLCHPYGFYFFSNDADQRKDYLMALEKFKNTKGRIDMKRRSAPSIYAGRINLKEMSEAVEWVENIGLKNKKSTQKEFPEFVFRLNQKQLSLLLAKMFEGDGCINLKRECPQIFYATSSFKLASQLQHLFLRLGVISTLHSKKFKYRGKFKKGYTLTFNRYENFEKLYYHLGPHFLSKNRKKLEKIIKTHPIISGEIKRHSARGSKDVVPVEIRERLREEIRKNGYSSFKQFAKGNGFSERLLWKDSKKKGYLRETLQMIGKKLNSKIICDFANSGIYWDEIIKIVPAGKEETYDLTIKGTHNFLANDFIVHNSHAAGYATIAYQTAYLKSHFPVEFMASLLTSEKNDVERIGFLISGCKKMGIDVLPPDINESLENFTVVPPKKIRFGLSAIKNVGHNIVETIVKERKGAGIYNSIFDFVDRINSRDLNKKSLESLIKAGAFDCLAERNQLLTNLEKLLEYSRENQKSRANGQKGLFDEMKFNNSFQLLPAQSVSKNEKLSWEKELLGLFVSSHPLEGFKNILLKKSVAIDKAKNNLINRMVRIGGLISSIKKIITRNGKPMLFMNLEDLNDKIEVVVFPGVIERNPTAFQENKIVLVSGRMDSRDGTPKLICEEVEEILEET